MDVPEVIEEFYGVYLLYCLNEKYLGRTYIGYTVDPNRRINQHNKGSWAGGAKRTSNRGPWKMIMIIHGFPNNIAALRFEWAWQNPTLSRRLAHVTRRNKGVREKQLPYRLRILAEMLAVGPWNRLPLSVRWLAEEFITEFPLDKQPPLHIPICSGPVKSKKISRTQDPSTEKILPNNKTRKKQDKSPIKNSQSATSNMKGKKFKSKSVHDIVFETNIYSSDSNSLSNCKKTDEIIINCSLCMKVINTSNKLTCLNSKCDLVSHLNCLSQLFLESGEYVPIEGDCPFCCRRLLWGDLIRKMKGCKDVQWEDESSDLECDLVPSDNCSKDNSSERNNINGNNDQSIVLYLSDSD